MRLREAGKAFSVLMPELLHFILPGLQGKWGCVREHQKRLKSRETAGTVWWSEMGNMEQYLERSKERP